MRNKGAIILVTVLLALISLYYLSFTFVVNKVESDADKYAETRFNSMNLKVDEFEKIHIIDSLSNRYLDSVVYLRHFTLFKNILTWIVRKGELNLG
jgi:SecD/SecF fusion protein